MEASSAERGNILFMILIAVVLIGLLTSVIMRGGSTENSNIDEETLAIRATEVQRAAAEFERAVLFILSSNKSENDLRFAHPQAHSDYGDITDDPARQVFSPQGGGAAYRKAPEGINDGSNWEFYGSDDIPSVGTGRADLVAVLPNVTQQFCNRINILNNQLIDNYTPYDSDGECLNIGANGRFNDAHQFFSSPEHVDEPSFAQDPQTNAARTALQACVQCDDGNNHFYHVLLAR